MENNIAMPTPGELQAIADEPAIDNLADKKAKEIKEKNKTDLTANDKFVLNLVDNLPIGDLIQKGYMAINLPIMGNVGCVARTLVYKQVEAIALDVSRFQQKREILKDDDGFEREVWKPSADEVNIYRIKRTLADVVTSVGDSNTGRELKDRINFFENLDSMMVNAIYRRVQQLFTATSLVFPSDNQKELLESLKKASAPLQ